MSSSKMYIKDNNFDLDVPAHLHYGKFILDRLRCYGDADAIEDGGANNKITYKELIEYAVKLSIALTRHGVRKGDVVALCSEPQLMFIPTALAILLSGASYAPIDSCNGRYHLRHKLSIIQPKYCIVSDLFWKNDCEILKSFDCIEKIMILDNPAECLLSVKSMISSIDEDLDYFEPVAVVGQVDTVLTVFSSGTTGMPKGVEISHLNALIYASHYPFKGESIKVAYLLADWYHTYDIFMAYRMLLQGTKIVYCLDYSADATLKALINTQVNVAFFVPSMVEILNTAEQKPNENLDCLKYFFIAASPLHAKVLDSFKKRFPSVKYILQGYGSTETYFITSQTMNQKNLKPGSVGCVCLGHTIKVVNPETRKLMGPNQQGEICVKGPSLIKGYSGLDPATFLDEDGFFKTGDLGYYDEEGDFFIVGRLKEMIDCDSNKVAPPELENIILMHPGVKEAGVVGKKAEFWGEVPCAFVVLQQGSNITEQEIIDFVAPEVADYMQLRGGVRFISDMPKNPRGKILRQELRKMLEEF